MSKITSFSPVIGRNSSIVLRLDAEFLIVLGGVDFVRLCIPLLLTVAVLIPILSFGWVGIRSIGKKPRGLHAPRQVVLVLTLCHFNSAEEPCLS